MSDEIKKALTEVVQTCGTVKSMANDELRWHKIEHFLKKEWSYYQL